MTHRQHGFTLIELMVAISIFSVMLLILTGIFTRFISIQRHDVGEFRLQEDLRLAFELFNREARLSYGNTFASQNNTVVFRNQTGACVTYRFNDEKFQRAEDSEVAGVACPIIFNDQLFEDLHSDQTVFRQMEFSVVPARLRDDGTTLESQGLVTISARVRSRGDQKEVPIQNSVSSRQVIPYRAL